MKRLTSDTPLTEFEAMNMSVTNLYARLKEYENTGLEPEEIANLLCEAINLKKELDEYTTAKRESRLLILPCKVGDRVYIHDGFEIFQCLVDRISISRGFKEIIVILPDRLRFGHKFQDIGKTVFLTREEAEAALKGGDANARKSRISVDDNRPYGGEDGRYKAWN